MTKSANPANKSPSRETDSQRLDTWLWAARFFKTRKLASEAIDGGKIDLNDLTVKKRGRAIRPGERLKIRKGQTEFEVVVQALNPQRGPATVAQTLYEETEASITRREEAVALRKAQAASRPPEHRPSGHDRALLRALRGKS